MATELPLNVRLMMAARARRMHHYLWHQVRNSWLRYPAETQGKLRKLGWQPPRPGRGNDGSLLLDNGSGEDFLYMHRRMIADVNAQLETIRDPAYARVEGWPAIPWPGDPNYPTPEVWDTGDADFDAFLVRVKSDAFYRATLATWEAHFREPSTLRRLTLGQLGSLLEYTVHNSIHMRWAADPIGSRPNPEPGEHPSIPAAWDDIDYDYLGDTYSSHVNPLFWKLHGWVDNRIEDWRRANRVDRIEWRGTWTGHMPLMSSGFAESEPHRDGTIHLEKMEAAVQAIAECGIVHEFYADDVAP